MNEIWRTIEDAPNYEVSNLGNVRHKKKKVNRKPQDNGHGYKIFATKINGKHKNFYIHRCVAKAFLDNPDNLPEVDHINSDRADNRVENLRWCTTKENANFEPHKLNLSRALIENGSQAGVNNPRAMRILQYDLDENFIREWDYIKQAAKELNILPNSISHCLHGRTKTSGGFIWRFAEEKQTVEVA